MQVNTNLNTASVPKVTPAPAPAGPARPASETEFSASQALDHALQQMPDVRPDAVAHGSKLAENPNYPPLELIKRLSRLVADSDEARE